MAICVLWVGGLGMVDRVGDGMVGNGMVSNGLVSNGMVGLVGMMGTVHMMYI